MAVELLHRRGGSTIVAGIIPNTGELLINTDDATVRVGDGAASGGWIAGGRRIKQMTTTSYTVLPSDQGSILYYPPGFIGAAGINLPLAGVDNNFPNGASIEILNLSPNTVMIIPTPTSTINTQPSLFLDAQNAIIFSDGVNYFGQTIASVAYGTWNPAPSISFGGASVGVTASFAAGRWIRSGHFCYATFGLELTSKGSSTGFMNIINLPFLCDILPGTCNIFFYDNLASIAGIRGQTISASTNAELYNSGAVAVTGLTEANFTNTSKLYGDMTYIAA